MKMNHLNHDELTGYIYRTLDDAQRESMDVHLLDCPVCRAKLSEQELRQRQISNELSAVLKATSPSPEMSFAAIAPQLQTWRTRLKFGSRLIEAAPTTFALLGLLFTLFGLWQAIGVRAITTPAQPLSAFPTLACFFFMLASVGQFDRTLSIRPRWVITWMVTLVLWLGSAFIGLLNLIVIRDLAIMAAVSMGWGARGGSPLAIIAVLIGTLFYIGLVIGGAEYHYRNLGHLNSWKLFSITLLGQLFLLILPYLVL